LPLSPGISLLLRSSIADRQSGILSKRFRETFYNADG